MEKLEVYVTFMELTHCGHLSETMNIQEVISGLFQFLTLFFLRLEYSYLLPAEKVEKILNKISLRF